MNTINFASLKAGGEGDDRGRDDWMASLPWNITATSWQWTGV